MCAIMPPNYYCCNVWWVTDEAEGLENMEEGTDEEVYVTKGINISSRISRC